MTSRFFVLGAVSAVVCASAAWAEDAPFVLKSTTVEGGGEVELTFPKPLPADQARYWVCLVEKGASDSSYGVWSYIEPDAKSHVLKAPAVDGAYEVRLHSLYPTKSNNVIHRVAVAVTGLKPTPAEGQKLVLATPSGPVDESVEVSFPGPLVPEAERRFWVSIVPAGAPDTASGLWCFVPAAATKVKLPAPTASGKHELRLHANYPKQSHNVVHRLAFEVTGAGDTAETDPASLKSSLALGGVACSDKPVVNFAIPVRPRTGERYWISLMNAELPESSGGLSVTIKPGAKSVTLAKPTSTGKHRVVVYCSYSKAPRQVVATHELDVTGGPQEAPTALDAITLGLVGGAKVGEKPKATFGTKLLARTGERFWVTWIEKGKEDREWGHYAYVPVGASELELPAPTEAGAYELRLHANYPTQSSNVVKRIDYTVE